MFTESEALERESWWKERETPHQEPIGPHQP
jgi:hypothetical protein